MIAWNCMWLWLFCRLFHSDIFHQAAESCPFHLLIRQIYLLRPGGFHIRLFIAMLSVAVFNSEIQGYLFTAQKRLKQIPFQQQQKSQLGYLPVCLPSCGVSAHLDNGTKTTGTDTCIMDSTEDQQCSNSIYSLKCGAWCANQPCYNINVKTLLMMAPIHCKERLPTMLTLYITSLLYKPSLTALCHRTAPSATHIWTNFIWTQKSPDQFWQGINSANINIQSREDSLLETKVLCGFL